MSLTSLSFSSFQLHRSASFPALYMDHSVFCSQPPLFTSSVASSVPFFFHLLFFAGRIFNRSLHLPRFPPSQRIGPSTESSTTHFVCSFKVCLTSRCPFAPLFPPPPPPLTPLALPSVAELSSQLSVSGFTTASLLRLFPLSLHLPTFEP